MPAKKIRQLENQLADIETVSDADVSQKISILNDLAWALSDSDLKRAQSLSETAYALANGAELRPPTPPEGGEKREIPPAGPLGGPEPEIPPAGPRPASVGSVEGGLEGAAPYQAGLAYSLRTQGYLNMRRGDHSLGLSQLFKAQEIFESLHLDEGLTDVLDHIAGIYFQIGNFPESLNYIYKQLETAQRLDDKRLIANAYNNLANIYFETGDYDRAIETLNQNLQIATDIDYKRIVSLSYMNLAETYLLAGDYEKSLENSLHGLGVNQEAGFELFEVYAFDLVGKSYLKLGNPSEAIRYLEQALALSRKVESKVTESLILLNMGQAYQDIQQLDQALDYIQQSIVTAQAIDARSELFKGHLLLSEIYEQQGDSAQALHHFKEHHAFKELVQSQKADERLKVLEVAHDTETAKKEAEIHRLHNVELKREIAERKQIEQVLQLGQERYHLATQAAAVGVWDWNLRTGEFYLDPTIKAILGYTDEEIPNDLEVWANYVHPDDRQAVMAAAQAHIEGRTPDYTYEHRMLHKDGSIRWIFVHGQVIKDDEGRVVRMVGTDTDITERKEAEEKLKRQIQYEEALAHCSRTLLVANRSKAENQHLLGEALKHLIEPAQASKIFLYENFDDPELGFCSRFIIDVCSPGIAPALDDPNSAVIPWSIAPAENRRRLAAGEAVGGPIKQVFADTPSFRDYLLQNVHILSVQFVPIHFGEYWWGYIGFDDRVNEREWREEEVRLLGTVAEILSNTLQRWQAQENLRTMNERLEHQVQLRTVDLTETIELLRQEIKERERAEAKIQQMVETLESRVAVRTEELATFFDLTVLAGQAVNLTDVFEYALPRILEVSRSRAICLHLGEAEGSRLRLAAQQGLSLAAYRLLAHVVLPPDFQHWLQQPHDPLFTTNLSQMPILPPAFRPAGFQSYLGVQIKVGRQVKGLLSCYRFTQRGFGLDEISLVTALAEQLGMVLETHRLRQSAREMAVIEERQRLARDLHDSVSQSLYSLSLFSRAGREAAEDGDTERLNDSLTKLEYNTLHTLREMRLLLYELRPADLEQEGLKRAVELRLNTVERRVGLQLDVRLDELPAISPQCEVELYHIIVEALNNIVKHAAATCLILHLIQADDRHLHLQIADDGQGFDLSATTGGLGVKHIRERVARLNGQLSLTSEPGQGTQMEAIIPYPMEES